MAKSNPIPKIQATKNYRLFARSDDNRPTDMEKHKALLACMKKYGFLPYFPIVCHRVNGQLIVRDGQHRLMIAETLGLTVYWVEATIHFDIAEINITSKNWGPLDFARKHAANGLKDYTEGIAFMEKYRLPVSAAFSLLSGNTSFSNLKTAFKSGAFKVKERTWADGVASLYRNLVTLSHFKHGKRLIEACAALCRVADFDSTRMVQNASKCREKLVSYSTREAYLAALEDVYNHGRHKKSPLKFQAEAAMQERNNKFKKTKPEAA